MDANPYTQEMQNTLKMNPQMQNENQIISPRTRNSDCLRFLKRVDRFLSSTHYLDIFPTSQSRRFIHFPFVSIEAVSYVVVLY